MNIMGISVDSPMRALAEHFLTLRSWGAPPIVIALAAQGAFRGLMDTKTPLFAVGVGNLLNGILDPILIFLLHLGIGGAAIATVISEYLITLILIWKLNKNIMLIPPNIDGEGILRYLKSEMFSFVLLQVVC
uniref:MATE efflux family protein 2, chloroplastic n=1 Tax=Anthurium amnicola TaxID=1678845 RepID=A0A1D1XZN6_9ARAE